MNWFFLSAFADLLRTKTDTSLSKVTDAYWKKSKFNEVYMKDKSKTEKLYAKFVRTKSYKEFLSSGSLSICFN